MNVNMVMGNKMAAESESPHLICFNDSIVEKIYNGSNFSIHSSSYYYILRFRVRALWGGGGLLYIQRFLAIFQLKGGTLDLHI